MRLCVSNKLLGVLAEESQLPAVFTSAGRCPQHPGDGLRELGQQPRSPGKEVLAIY